MAKPTCSVDDCGEPARANSYCATHNARFKRHGDPLAGGPTRRRAKGRTCDAEGCAAEVVKGGLCGKHYQRRRKTGTTAARVIPTAERRFWAKVDVRGPDECWPWKPKASHPFGYGRLKVNGHDVGAHVFAWVLANGPLPSGLLVRHSCDNPPCCNPAHLLSGTIADNNRDAYERGRHKPISPHPTPGEEHWNAQLTRDDVRDIRARVRAGEHGSDVAVRYGITPTHVSRISAGKSWGHVT